MSEHFSIHGNWIKPTSFLEVGSGLVCSPLGTERAISLVPRPSSRAVDPLPQKLTFTAKIKAWLIFAVKGRQRERKAWERG